MRELIKTSYIDDQGNLKPLYYKIVHDFKNQKNIDVIQNLVEQFNESVLVLRSISEYEKFDSNTLLTENINLSYHNPTLKFLELPEPFFGSVHEGLVKNIKLMVQLKAYEHTISIGNSDIVVSECTEEYANSVLFKLVELNNTGIQTHVKEVRYEFDDERNPNCDSCKLGLAAFNDKVQQMNTLTYSKLDTNIGLVTGNVINDLTINDDSQFLNNLNILLAQTIAQAKIKNLFL